MKELNIEQKAKAYDEALKVASKYKDIHIMFSSIQEEMFPELAESEDERIRKELLNAFKEATDSLYMVLTPSKREAFISWLEKQGDQKPWSEEDEKIFDAIYSCVDSHYDGLAKTSLLIWLKSLKDRVLPQPKQERSEEDEKLINSVIELIDNGALDRDEKDYFIEKLKSLIPQSTWKPSKEQMKALNTCIMQGEISYLGIQSLYDELKKLMEE